jgi:hypothetical protein
VLLNLKGCGGGGGGGSLTILALGDIKLIGAGSIDASGGCGGGGENTNGTNRIGGGSGGGSGGHIILQTASKIDLSAVTMDEDGSIYPQSEAGGIYAVGGQGGEGQFGVGGASANGHQTTPLLDALPPNSYPSTGSNQGPCAVDGNVVGNTGTTGSAGPIDVVYNCGGDGGPGIIQLHAPSVADILPPTGNLATLGRCVRPYPVGSTPDNVDNPAAPWDLLLPIFSRFSTAQSKWIPLGTATVEPGSTTPDPVSFVFDGTDTDGVGVQGAVETDGVGDAATVRPLPSILTPTTLATEPTLPFITADKRTIVLDRTTLTDDIYVRNPALLRRFELRLSQPGVTKSFEVASAQLGTGNELRLTVTGTGTPLSGFGFGASVVLRPRFFRVITDGTADSLPASSVVVIQFQAAPANSQGAPSTTVGPLGATDWVPDIATINTHPNVANFRFIRFRVTFDIVADGGQLSFETPIPTLDFLRVPFRF